MTTYSKQYLDRIVDRCFAGDRARNCSSCPSNYTRKGPCCFGDPDKHDPENDEECNDCHLVYECNEAAHKAVAKASNQYRKYTNGRKPVTTSKVVRPQSALKAKQRGGLVQLKKPKKDGEGRGELATAVDYADMEGTLFNRFMRSSATGALQGTFEMAADFWRKHHL